MSETYSPDRLKSMENGHRRNTIVFLAKRLVSRDPSEPINMGDREVSLRIQTIGGYAFDLEIVEISKKRSGHLSISGTVGLNGHSLAVHEPILGESADEPFLRDKIVNTASLESSRYLSNMLRVLTTADRIERERSKAPVVIQKPAQPTFGERARKIILGF
ncbi:MAG: hypothetical protein Q7R51_00820 [bacterium]|nr:hypothetical protein [bacterium]